mmetsp:Transcript_4828/g.7054  ORF Transcript_4828/g.7054 Transcript_4828/m.7054 type:complete len:145 (+) Transcript_4828:448-882(+)
MSLNGRKPPLNPKEIVETVDPTKNAMSCVGRVMQQKRMRVDPTRPDTIRVESVVRKDAQAGTVGFNMPHMGIAMEAPRVDANVTNTNSMKTWLTPYIHGEYKPIAISAARNFLSPTKIGIVANGNKYDIFMRKVVTRTTSSASL